MLVDSFQPYFAGYVTRQIDSSVIIQADCFELLNMLPEASIHAIVTDPPYGVKEFEADQLRKKEDGTGEIWRIPPAFDGSTRSPLPRFTALSAREINGLRDFFSSWSELALKVLKPGGHLFLASNAYLSQIIYAAIVESGFEFRGEIIRLVRTMRGGDRPKNAETLFPDVCTLPRSCYEPWGLFRKPLPEKMTVAECLASFQTGGLRRTSDGKPFSDVIESTRTPVKEKEIAPHPSLKPQAFLRQIVYAALPLGSGIVLDPFMGSGSTIAAAEAVGYPAIGIERYSEYFELSQRAILPLKKLVIPATGIYQLELFHD